MKKFALFAVALLAALSTCLAQVRLTLDNTTKVKPSFLTVLGTGAPSSANYLRGDGTWQPISAGTVTGISGDSGTTTGLTLSVGTGTTTPALTLGGALTLAHGGTGATTPVDARAALGLSTAATHDAGDFDASTGVLPPGHLGTGTPSNATILRGDGAWAPLPVPANTLNFAPQVTGASGGGPTNLDGTATAGLPNYYCLIIREANHGLTGWVLEPDADSSDGCRAVTPADHNSVSNARTWRQRL